eukprot:GHVQ01016083.1.p1 GENE.GHVQ01016083.1~~GHVQ01016083.1.p1  ORF type:complete len:659 (+),score=92.37 GHVQ01016083.1:176-2152(+)
MSSQGYSTIHKSPTSNTVQTPPQPLLPSPSSVSPPQIKRRCSTASLSTTTSTNRVREGHSGVCGGECERSKSMAGKRESHKETELVMRGAFTKTIHPEANLMAGGSPADLVDTVEELANIPGGFRLPSMKEIRDCIPEHCRKRCIFRSSAALLRDIAYIAITSYIVYKISHIIGGYSIFIDFPLWLTYAVIQGTFATGVWVVGHECGHGAFSPWPLVNDAVGYVVHIALLVPYHSWKYSHNKHHQYTNHLTWGETHVPGLLSEMGESVGRFAHVRKWLGDDAFAACEAVAHLIAGWPMYVLTNATGGRRGWDGKGIGFHPVERYMKDGCGIKQQELMQGRRLVERKKHGEGKIEGEGTDGSRGDGGGMSGRGSVYVSTPSEVKKEFEGTVQLQVSKVNHFVGQDSLLYPPDVQYLVTLSGMGCAVVLAGLIAWGSMAGWTSVMRWYVGPYLVTNFYLVLYTWLHHTHPNIPHYGDESFTWLRGALSTIDRPYPWILDAIHHGIGTTHVLHHMDFKIPHYHAAEASWHLRQLIGPLYRIDTTGILKATWQVCKLCHYVDSIDSVQYIKSVADAEALLSQSPTAIFPPKYSSSSHSDVVASAAAHGPSELASTGNASEVASGGSVGVVSAIKGPKVVDGLAGLDTPAVPRQRIAEGLRGA